MDGAKERRSKEQRSDGATEKQMDRATERRVTERRSVGATERMKYRATERRSDGAIKQRFRDD